MAMTFWSPRRGRTVAHIIAILIYLMVIAIGGYFVVSTLFSTAASSIARLVAVAFVIFLLIGGAFVWHRVTVMGETLWGDPSPEADLLKGVWKETPPPPPPPPPAPGASEDEVIGYIRALRENYLIEEAIAFMRSYLEPLPKALRPRLLLASLLSGGLGEDFPEARRIYEEVLSEYPDNIPALCGLAMLRSPGQIVSAPEAAELLAKAADISDDPEIIWTYAHTLLDTGDWEGAKAGFERVLAHPRSGPPTTLRRRAKEILKDIKRRRHPKYSGYSWPEM